LGKLGPVAAEEAALGIELEARRGLGQIREAEALAEQAVVQFPRSARLARLRGQLYLDEKQLPQARTQLERATQLNPVDDQAWYLLGLLYRQQGDARAAQTAEARAAELRQIYTRLTELSRQAIQEPANPDLRDELARLCRQIQRDELAQMWEQAARNLRQPPRTDP
jgi:tetratricopeptide (TPR) repeat protein